MGAILPTPSRCELPRPAMRDNCVCYGVNRQSDPDDRHSGQWRIRKPFRLLVDERSLPS